MMQAALQYATFTPRAIPLVRAMFGNTRVSFISLLLFLLVAIAIYGYSDKE